MSPAPVNVFPNVLKISNLTSEPLYVQLGTTQGTPISTPYYFFIVEANGDVLGFSESPDGPIVVSNLSTSGVTPLNFNSEIPSPVVAAYWGGNIIFGSGSGFYSLSPALNGQPVAFTSPGVTFKCMAAGSSLWGVDTSNDLWVYDEDSTSWVKQNLSLPGGVEYCASTAAGIFMAVTTSSGIQLGQLIEGAEPSVTLIGSPFIQGQNQCGLGAVAQPLQIGGYSVTFWFASSDASGDFSFYSMVYNTGQHGNAANLSEVVPGPPQIGLRNDVGAICFASNNGLLYFTAINTSGGGSQAYVYAVDPVLNCWVPLQSTNKITALANNHFAAGLSLSNATFSITSTNPVGGGIPSASESTLYYTNQPSTTSNGKDVGQSFFVGNPPGGTQLTTGWPYYPANEGVHVRLDVDSKSGGFIITELDIDPLTLAD